MKKLSKVLSVICALVLVASLGVTAFAGSVVWDAETDFDTPQKQNVTIDASDIPELGNVYCVTVDWTDLNFVFTATGDPGWNEQRHEETAVPGTWNSTSGTVKVTNDSNVDVYGKIVYEQDEGYEANVHSKGVTVTGDSVGATKLNKGTEANVGGVGDEDPTNQNVIEAGVSVAGTPTETITAGSVAGTFTATVATTEEALGQ